MRHGRQLHGSPGFAVARAGYRSVHSEAKRAVASRLDALHQLTSETVIGLHIKLKPQRTLCHGRHIFKARAGKATEHHSGAGRARRSRGSQLSVYVKELLTR